MRISLAALSVCFALAGYFGYFAIYGRHGVVNYVQLSHEAELRQADLDTLKAERTALERRVNMLKPDSIDRDLLEERARDVLGLTAPGELVLPRGTP